MARALPSPLVVKVQRLREEPEPAREAGWRWGGGRGGARGWGLSDLARYGAYMPKTLALYTKSLRPHTLGANMLHRALIAAGAPLIFNMLHR